MQLTIEEMIKPLTRKQVRDSIYRLMAAMGLPVTSWQEGSVARTIIAVIAALFAGYTEVMALAIRGGFLDLAEGVWLTLLAYYVYGVRRIEATFASGEVTLVNSGGGIFEFEPGEFICKNAVTGKQYTNTAFFRLEAGQTLTTAIRAVEIGAASSATPGQITQLVTTMREVACSNQAPVTGRNAESDPELRQRCRDSLGALSPNGPEAAYVFWAKSAVRSDGLPVNVNRVWVSKGSSVGHVTVYVASPNGAVPGTIGDDSTDLGAVDKAIRTRVVPIEATCTVASAVPRQIPVTGTVWVQAAANLGPAQWQAMINTQIESYLSEAPIGGYVLTSPPGYIYRNAIIGAVEAVSKFVIKFDPMLPEDTALAEGEVPVAAANSITVQQVGQ